MNDRTRSVLRFTGDNDPASMSRALGVLLICGSSLVGVGLLLTMPTGANVAGLAAVAACAVLVGVACIIWADRVREPVAHAVFAGGTGAICLGIYFAGVSTGIYSFLLVWLVVVAASFFSRRAIAAHVAWIVLASGVAMATSSAPGGVSPGVRWVFGCALLAIAAAVMSQIVAGRRAVEDRLREEIAANARLQRELEHLAHHDPLTGLPNRRRFQQELGRELLRARRDGTSLCLVAIDLDDFKEFNDAHGHAAGDQLLQQAGSAWTQAVRATDLVARLGGDEFVALLRDCPPEEAEHTVDRLGDEYPAGLTFSAGVACWDRHESADQLLQRADAEMYCAKIAMRARRAVGGTPVAARDM